MENIQGASTVLEFISKNIGYIAAVITGLGIILGFIFKWWKKLHENLHIKISKHYKLPVMEEELKELRTETEKKFDALEQSYQRLGEQIVELNTEQDRRNVERFDQIDEFLRRSQMDAQRAQIYEAADRARQGKYISGEYYTRIRDVLHEYETLGGDGAAHSEWDFFNQYYNNQPKK